MIAEPQIVEKGEDVLIRIRIRIGGKDVLQIINFYLPILILILFPNAGTTAPLMV